MFTAAPFMILAGLALAVAVPAAFFSIRARRLPPDGAGERKNETDPWQDNDSSDSD